MVILETTDGTNFSNGKYATEVNTPIESVSVVFTWDVTIAPTFASLAGMLADVTLNMQFKTKSGSSVVMYPDVDLHDVAEYAQYGEGAIEVLLDSNGKVLQMSVPIPVADDAAILMNNDEKLLFSIEGLPTTNTFKMSLEGIEVPTRTHRVIRWNQLDVPSPSKKRKIDLVGVDNLILPVSTVLKYAQVHYTNTENPQYTQATLQHLMRQNNDLVVVDRGFSGKSIPFYSNIYTLGVDTAKRVELYTDGSGYSFFIVDSVAVGSKAEAMAVNAALVSTREDAEDIEDAAAEKL